jgi:hypothetical protein
MSTEMACHKGRAASEATIQSISHFPPFEGSA